MPVHAKRCGQWQRRSARGKGDLGIGESAFCKMLPGRCAHGPCPSPEGSVAGFTWYRLCHRPPFSIVLLYCVVLCCRRDGLGSIYTKRTTEPNGVTETMELNRTTDTRNHRHNGSQRNSGNQRKSGTNGTAKPTGITGPTEIKGTTEPNGKTEPKGRTESNRTTEAKRTIKPHRQTNPTKP